MARDEFMDLENDGFDDDYYDMYPDESEQPDILVVDIPDNTIPECGYVEIDTDEAGSIDLMGGEDGIIEAVIDDLKRIKPAEKSLNEKEELKNITNELKTIAIEYDIPVITAQQLNRTSASVIDAAIEAKKEDITRLIGRDGVGSAWEVRLNQMVFPYSNV